MDLSIQTKTAAASAVFALLSLLMFKSSRKLLSRVVLVKKAKKNEDTTTPATEPVIPSMTTPPTRPSLGQNEDDIFYSILRQYRGSDSGRKSFGMLGKFRTSEG